MTTKGITIWEQHAEKIVLGIAAVAAIGLAAKQFIGEPNAVSTPAGTISPAEIDGRLQSEAERYLARGKLRFGAATGRQPIEHELLGVQACDLGKAIAHCVEPHQSRLQFTKLGGQRVQALAQVRLHAGVLFGLDA